MGMKIIKVVDTRMYIESENDRWVPVPGTGDMNICERCGKGHEVHYTVENDGRAFVVGGGCATKAGIISEVQHKGIGSAVMTLTKNKAKLAKLLADKEIYAGISAKVDAMELPLIEADTDFWQMGDAKVKIWPNSDSKERKETLIYAWKRNRIHEIAAELGFKGCSPDLRNWEISDLEYRITKMEKKIAKLLEGK